MATTDTTNYSRTILILVKGGTKVTRRLLMRRIGPDLSIDDFLSQHKIKILQHQTGKNKENIFFPQPPIKTDLEKWDLYMLCFILCETCNLSNVLDMRIKKLQKLRNKLCHMSDATLSDREFEEYMDNIDICFEKCLKEINDSGFTEELNALVSSVRHEPLALEDTVRLMHTFYKMDHEQMKVLEKHTKDHEEHGNKLDEMISKMDTVISLLADGASVDVPALEIVIEVKNCSSDKEAKVYEFLVDRLNELIDEKEPEFEDDISNGALHKIREILQQTLKDLFALGRHLIRVEEKCILLRIKCTSLSSFVCLLRDYRSDQLTHQLNGIKMAFRLFDGCSDVELDTCIFEDTFWRVMDGLLVDIEEQIPKQHTLIPVHSNSEPTGRKDLVSLNGDRVNDLDDSPFADYTLPEYRKSEKKCVRITVQMPTQNDQKQLQERFESGDIDHGMETLQEEVGEQLQIPNVSITARLFQGGEGLKKGFFDDSRKELPRLSQKQQTERDLGNKDAFQEINNARILQCDTLHDASSQGIIKKSEESASRDDDSKVQSGEIETRHNSRHKTNPIKELLFSQIEVAKFLEFAYLALWDQPEVAAEIRSTAQKSRTQHVLTADLFKKFVVTASSVVNTYCLMMLDAVELEDKDIVVEAFEQVLEMCLDMKKETEDARESYLTIQDKVQNDLSKVNITNKDERSKIEALELENKTENEFVKEAARQQMELDKEKEELQNKVKKLQENRDEWLEETAPPTDKREAAHTFIDFAMIPSGALIAGPIRAAAGIADTALSRWRKKEKHLIKISHEADEHLPSTYEEKRTVEKKALNQLEEALAKIAHIEALNLQKASLGVILSLKEAMMQLCNVDKQLMRIIIFLDSMTSMLKHLIQDQKAGKVYLKKIEDKRYTDKFKLSIDKAEYTWNRIGIVCQNYVEKNDEIIFNVYGFLSSPVYIMPKTVIAKRKAELIAKIKYDAENSDN